MNRANILTTVAFLSILGIMIADFSDNGVIDNDKKFLIVSLFVFSGAGAGRAIDAIVDRYIGNTHEKYDTKNKE